MVWIFTLAVGMIGAQITLALVIAAYALVKDS